MTLVLKVRTPSIQSLRYAARILKEGGIVAFPTETVYGLGANALDTKAVRKIFEAKGRPSDNPLIVHVHSIRSARQLAHVTPRAKLLMKKFWPGPLTLVLKKKTGIPGVVTSGLSTVAIRMPSHTIALRLIRMAGVPVAAPSANRAGRPSPTRAEHVLHDLDRRIDLILDGGPTHVGLESTVVDMTGHRPVILRPGQITAEAIARVLRETTAAAKSHSRPRSPGMKYRHYAPDARLILVEGSCSDARKTIQKIYRKMKMQGKRAAWVDFLDPAPAKPAVDLGRRLSTVAKKLFATLRDLDNAGVDVILIRNVPEKGIGTALMNRLRKAADEIIHADKT